jgi:hypothetical protein
MNPLTQYADIFIPLGVSILTGLVSFAVYKIKVDRLETEVKEIKIEIKEIRDKTIACETSLKERGPLKKSKSPVSLTERGEKVINDSGGKSFVDANYTELKNKVEEKDPKTSYDIQEVSHKILMDLKSDVRINPIKEYAFNEGLELNDVLDIMGIHLRDLILKEKGIAVEDIDVHVPNK